MFVFRHRLSQTTLNWLLTALACVALLTTVIYSSLAKAELRAFRLKITNTTTGTEREVITRFDHVQYGMYRYLKPSEVVDIAQTWMCYDRSDYVGTLCAAPPQSPETNMSGGPGLQDRRPATTTPEPR